LSQKDGVGIDGAAVPPALVGGEFEDCEVEMRRGGAGVAGRSDVGDHSASFYVLAFMERCSIVIEMRVVIAISLRIVEEVNSIASGLAQEELWAVAKNSARNRKSLLM
jgi:hypothetical protein